MKTLVRTLNSQAYRTIFQTIPQWHAGTNLGMLLQGELGLHTTSDIRKRRESMGLGKPKQVKAPKGPGPDEAILASLEKLATGNIPV